MEPISKLKPKRNPQLKPKRNPRLAGWLVSRRQRIQQVMDSRLGSAAPSAGADESEALRRFRSYATSALQRGAAVEPVLDGLRIHERRVASLLDAWTEAAADVAESSGDSVRAALAPLAGSFRTALRGTGTARRKRGAPRTSARRAVPAAIDRVSDAFLAIDVDSREIVDANPAAGALLGVARDALLGVEAHTFLPGSTESDLLARIDAVCEGVESTGFHSELRDAQGAAVPVDCSLTRFATRSRVLALLLARPVH